MNKKTKNISGVSQNLARSIKTDIQKSSSTVDMFLNNKRIGISVSDSEDFLELGFSNTHQKDITVELTRYLLANGAHIVYGGDLRKDGYTMIFSELAFQYRSKQEHQKIHFTNYFAWPINLNLKNSDEATFKKNRVNVVKVNCPKEVPAIFRGTFLKDDSNENKYYWAMSMSKMRDQMVKKCSARVFIGGKITNYKGFYPGIIEEAFYSLNQKQPIYLIGAFGGASKILIRAIKGENTKKLSQELIDANPNLNLLNSYCKNINKSITPLTDILNEFKKFGIKRYSNQNNLSIQQNEILFETIHFHEMIYYFLKGIKKAI